MTCSDCPVDDGLGAPLCAVEAVVTGTDPHHPEVRPMGTDQAEQLGRLMHTSVLRHHPEADNADLVEVQWDDLEQPVRDAYRAVAGDVLAALATTPDGDHATVDSVVLRDHGLAELGLNHGTPRATTMAPDERTVTALREVRDSLAAHDVGADRDVTLSTNVLGVAVAHLDAVLANVTVDEDPPVGPTVTDPATGERSEFDPFDVDHDAQAEADALAGAAEADAAAEAEQAHAAGGW